MTTHRPRRRGMTFVELVLCLFILSVLASAAFPLVENGDRREREIRLAEALRGMREAIDRHYERRATEAPGSTEAERYPPTLAALVQGRMLRSIPVDPMTGERDWICISTTDDDPTDRAFTSDGANVFDVRSSSEATDRRGRAYRLW